MATAPQAFRRFPAAVSRFTGRLHLLNRAQAFNDRMDKKWRIWYSRFFMGIKPCRIINGFQRFLYDFCMISLWSYMLIACYYDGIQPANCNQKMKEANIGNTDQQREVTHQNESTSGFHTAKSWHRKRGRMALVEVTARFNYGMPSRLPPTSFWQFIPLPSPIYL